jgi:hypothetical protein
MKIDIAIEVLPEPEISFASGKVGVDPRAMMLRYGAADKSPGRDIKLGLVGAPDEIKIAKQWLVHLNLMSVAFEKNSKRYRDWPGAQHAFGVNFVVDERFVRVVDQARLDLALHEPAQIRRFDSLLELFDSRIQSLFGDVRPDCILVCLPDELADLRISNPDCPKWSERLWNVSGRGRRNAILPFPTEPGRTCSCRGVADPGGRPLVSKLLPGTEGASDQSTQCDPDPGNAS